MQLKDFCGKHGFHLDMKSRVKRTYQLLCEGHIESAYKVLNKGFCYGYTIIITIRIYICRNYDIILVF